MLTDPSKDIQAKIAESMIRSFSERVQTVAVSTKSVVTELAKSQQSDVAQVAKEVSGSLQTIATASVGTSKKER